MSLDALADKLAGALTGEVSRERSLAPLTTYRLGGPAALYVEPASEDDVARLAEILSGQDVPLLALGRGSNLVVSDRGWPGVVIRLGPPFSWTDAVGERGLGAGGATALPLLANWAARRGLTGAEFTVSIPGSVGGAVRMNAGAHGAEIADLLASARVFDLRTVSVEDRPAAALALAYRRSNLTANHLVLSAALHLSSDDPPAIRERMEAFRKQRAATQPGAAQNAGSVFKNPVGDHAGRLVEAAGLKGFTVGGARVSDLHANFFIAGGNARSQDVFDLVHEVRARVRDRFGVELEAEIRFVGEFEERT
jgi:UDP-N-acetylmuramate dehydrogenase